MRKIVILAILVVFGLSFSGCEVDPDATYKVIYLANTTDTYGTVPIDYTEYKSGDEAIVLDEGTLQKTGFTFIHWNTDKDDLGVSYVSGDIITITNINVFLYAIWAEISPRN